MIREKYVPVKRLIAVHGSFFQNVHISCTPSAAECAINGAANGRLMAMAAGGMPVKRPASGEPAIKGWEVLPEAPLPVA